MGPAKALHVRADLEIQGEDGALTITRTSMFTRKKNTMTLPIRHVDLLHWSQGGGLIQDVFPQLDAEQREFLMSGATPEEWAEVFAKEEE